MSAAEPPETIQTLLEEVAEALGDHLEDYVLASGVETVAVIPNDWRYVEAEVIERLEARGYRTETDADGHVVHVLRQ